MVNIDLKTSGTQRSAYEAKTDSSLVMIILLTLIVLGVAGGFYYWKMSITKNIASIDEEIKTETANLTNQNTKNVMDFQKRLEIADKNVDEENILLASFIEIEKTIIPDVYISSVSYNDNGLSIGIVAKDFASLAKQIASFKNSEDFFREVGIGDASVNSDQKVETTLTLSIN